MSKTTYNVGDEVILTGDVRAEVISHNRGWYTLDGNRKVRTGDILGLAEIQDDERNLSNTMKEYRQKYTKARGYNGNPTLNNGDDLAMLLAKLSPLEVVTLTERVLKIKKGGLSEKYAHLNPGQQRMCCGNKLRSAIKSEAICMGDIKNA